MLKNNKDYFDEVIYNVEMKALKEEVTRKNINWNFKVFKNEKSFKDEDHQLRDKLLRVFEDGVVARMRPKK